MKERQENWDALAMNVSEHKGDVFERLFSMPMKYYIRLCEDYLERILAAQNMAKKAITTIATSAFTA